MWFPGMGCCLSSATKIPEIELSRRRAARAILRGVALLGKFGLTTSLTDPRPPRRFDDDDPLRPSPLVRPSLRHQGIVDPRDHAESLGVRALGGRRSGVR